MQIFITTLAIVSKRCIFPGYLMLDNHSQITLYQLFEIWLSRAVKSISLYSTGNAPTPPTLFHNNVFRKLSVNISEYPDYIIIGQYQQ